MALAWRDHNLLASRRPENRHHRRLADPFVRQQAMEIVDTGDRRARESDHDVAVLQSGSAGGATRFNRDDEYAGRDRELILSCDRSRNRDGLAGEADVASTDAPVANQSRRDEPRGVARNREAQS